jgi:hypothetical protein
MFVSPENQIEFSRNNEYSIINGRTDYQFKKGDFIRLLSQIDSL